MADEKNINLMPEDLRSKEEDVKAGKTPSFHIDLVVPDVIGQKKYTNTRGLSFWQKIKDVFVKKSSFTEPLPKKETPKKDKEKEKKLSAFDFGSAKEKKSKPEIEEVHLPKKEAQPKFEYIKHKESHIDFSLPDSGKQKPKNKVSFWSKIKNIFGGQKQPKIKTAKPLKVSDSILLKGSNGNGKKPEPLSLVSRPMPEKTDKAFGDASKAALETGSEILPTKEETVKSSDFSIPELKVETPLASTAKPEAPFEIAKSEKEVKEEKTKKKKPEFHKPKQVGKMHTNGGGAEVDLIPDAARTRSWRQVSVLIFTSFLGAFLIVGAFYGVLFFQEKNIQNQQQRKAQQISDLEVQILNYENLNKEISDLGREIRTVNNILNKHIYWTNFFALLEKYTPAEVYYQGISAGNNGALTLSAIGSNYDSPARLLKILEQEQAKEFVEMASISSASSNDQGVAFNVTLVLNEALFYYSDDFED